MRALLIFVPVIWFALGMKFYGIELGIVWGLCSFIGAAALFLLLRGKPRKRAEQFSLAGGLLTPVCITALLVAFFVPFGQPCDDPPCTMVLTIPAAEAEGTQ